MPEKVITAGQDLRALTDTLRMQQRVVQNEAGEWILLHYDDVVRAARDDSSFSSAVSRFLQIPNGLDGDEHTAYRQLIDKYLTAEAIAPFTAKFQQSANDIVAKYRGGDSVVDAVRDLGAVFAARAQCIWLGWPAELEPKLLQWMEDNHKATRSGDHEQTAHIAQRFDELLEYAFTHARTQARQTGQSSVTAQLDSDEIKGRPLTHDEKISILRNWTAGDLGSMALCIGVLVAFLARKSYGVTLAQLRHYSDDALALFVDEVIRLDNPFISNRRITTDTISWTDQQIPDDTVVRLNWISANRDEAVFGADHFCPVSHAPHNLVYGVGKHVCPGRLLATTQLLAFLKALIGQLDDIKPVDKAPFRRAKAPTGGYSSVPVRLIKRN